MEHIQKAKNDPLGFVHNTDKQIVMKLLIIANEYYRTSDKLILSDEEYDIIYEEMKKLYPDHSFFKEIGSSNEPGKDVKLPYFMGGMDKYYNSEEIQKWVCKNDGPYTITDKLDGNSGILVKNGNSIKLYSRGDGTFGRDLSSLIPFLNIPNLELDYIAVRGEIIISKQNYEPYKDVYKNPRSFTNGITTRKDTKYNHLLDFVAFDLVEPVLETHESFKYLHSLGFKIPNTTQMTSINKELLTEILDKHRDNSSYIIDGIIVTNSGKYEPIQSGNPKHSMAFKVNGLGEQTIVKNVVYNASKYGKLVPVIECEPIVISGSTISNISGQSAKYILENRINVGTEIRVILSGEIIPYIVNIYSSESIESGLLPTCDFDWDSTKTHIYSKASNDKSVLAKRIVSFIKTLGIEYVSIGIINKLIENGYETLSDILQITKDKLLEIDGFKEVLATKIVTSIESKIQNEISLDILMTASLCFGSGLSRKRIQSALSKYPDLLHKEYSIEDFNNINGFSDKTSNSFKIGLEKFKKFLIQNPFLKISNLSVSDDIDPDQDQEQISVVLTGFRDKKIMDSPKVKILNSISKKIDFLIIQNSEYKNKKVELAKELGIPVITKEEFYSKLL